MFTTLFIAHSSSHILEQISSLEQADGWRAGNDLICLHVEIEVTSTNLKRILKLLLEFAASVYVPKLIYITRKMNLSIKENNA